MLNNADLGDTAAIRSNERCAGRVPMHGPAQSSPVNHLLKLIADLTDSLLRDGEHASNHTLVALDQRLEPGSDCRTYRRSLWSSTGAGSHLES